MLRRNFNKLDINELQQIRSRFQPKSTHIDYLLHAYIKGHSQLSRDNEHLEKLITKYISNPPHPKHSLNGYIKIINLVIYQFFQILFFNTNN